MEDKDRVKCTGVVWAPMVGLQLKSECGQRLSLILVAKEAKPPSYSIICCPGGVRCPSSTRNYSRLILRRMPFIPWKPGLETSVRVC